MLIIRGGVIPCIKIDLVSKKIKKKVLNLELGIQGTKIGQLFLMTLPRIRLNDLYLMSITRELLQTILMGLNHKNKILLLSIAQRILRL